MSRLSNPTAPRPIRVHDAVLYNAHPEWGYGHVSEHLETTGMLRVDFEVDGRLYADWFAAGELTRATPTVQRVA